MKMKYTYNENKWLHVMEEAFDTSGKPAPVKPIKIRVPPRTLEPISEEDIKFYNGGLLK